LMRPKGSILTVVVAIAIAMTATLHSTSTAHAATAGIQSFNKPCLRDYKNWTKKRGWKAIAETAVYSDGQGCGMSWEFVTKSGATAYALKRCRQQLYKHHPKTKDPCRVTVITK
jgi:hypothetical protein